MLTQIIKSQRQRNMMNKCMIVGACAVICLAALAQAQYNTYDSDSNSDSDENPILTKTELGKLVRNSAKQNLRNNNNNINTNQQYQQQLSAATRNLYNRQQPMQYAPTQNNRRQFGGSNAELQGYGPMMGASARGGREAQEANDDEDSSSNAFGPNYNGNSNNNDDDGEGSNAEGGSQPMNLNQAASGYPGMGQNDYGANDASGAAGFNFGGASGYGPSAEGSEFGPSSADGFSGEGRRHKSASSPSSSRNYGSDDELAGALQYGPNSAINAGEGEEDSRAGYAPEGQNDNDNDDE